MSLSPEERADRRRERRATYLRDTFEGQYGELTDEELKTELLQVLRVKKDLEEQKKASADGFNEQIKDKKDAIDYITERIDYVMTDGARLELENQADELLEAA